MGKKIKYTVDEVRTLRKRKVYVRVWKEKRNWVVQLWYGTTPTGEPNGDWEMPGVLPVDTAIAQADIQTPYPV